jgi:anti-sigma regulatory factor (Ser/Thr protein kinase)
MEGGDAARGRRGGAGMTRFGTSDRTWTLRAAPDAPSRARRLVRSWLGADDRRLDRVELLLSELVTNVVHHVGSPMVVRCRRLPGTVRIEVADASVDPPRVIEAPGSRSGYGLRIVESLADDWGFESLDGGKAVWFEVHDDTGSADDGEGEAAG